MLSWKIPIFIFRFFLFIVSVLCLLPDSYVNQTNVLF
ncbi:Protein CBG25627 [Caenorhabditis briggsae]|uniref:Protein CBG25627 n=1 Tax=Caenorhabditis briggsae TaxID=6238 RepID=B6IFB1_CAEBR|nr:Protein CBG25627 [Caenorhabditis briggsae]CAR98591.1 Protein CBG25627 [Caenorhabditis briggsae]